MPVTTYYEFGPYRLDVPERRLSRDGTAVALSPKALDVLIALVERRDRVVEKSELMRLLWPDAFVEESNLSQTVFVLRRVLGTAADGRQYIDTIPRRGYRFAAEVSSDAAPVQAQPEPVPPVVRTRWHRWIGGGFALAAMLLLVMLDGSREGLRPAGAVSGRTMLAVLPFENLTGDRTQEYFSDGLTDAMISELGRVQPSRLGVIARTSVMTYKGRPRRIDQIGADLHVDYVLEGSVRRSGPLVSIVTQLIQVKDQSRLWSREYERNAADILRLESGLARDVATRIVSELTPQAARPRGEVPAIDAEAYQLYLKGRYFSNKRTAEGLTKGLQYFQQSIAADGAYAEAYVALGNAYVLASTFSLMPRTEALPKARAAALKALALEPGLGEAHVTLAFLDWDQCEWMPAEAHFKQAIDLAPASPTAHHWYALFLKDLGRFDEAISEVRRAETLDPLSLVIKADVALVFFFARRPAEAMAQLRQTLEMDPGFELALEYTGWVYEQQGQYAQAVAVYKSIPRLNKTSIDLAMLCRAYALSGRRREALAVLDQLAALVRDEPGPAEKMTLAYAGLNDADGFLRSLDAERRDRAICMAPFLMDPRFDLVRSDPRFSALLKRVRY